MSQTKQERFCMMGFVYLDYSNAGRAMVLLNNVYLYFREMADAKEDTIIDIGRTD